MPAGRPRTRQEGDLCEDCGINPVRSKGYTPSGNLRYDKRCTGCHKASTSSPWLKHRGDSCESCGYTPFWSRSLDVHHRDGDKSNNDPDNLMTLCATCHREIEGFIHQCEGNHKMAEGLLRRFMNSLTG